jgi:hypothetical protein
MTHHNLRINLSSGLPPVPTEQQAGPRVIIVAPATSPLSGLRVEIGILGRVFDPVDSLVGMYWTYIKLRQRLNHAKGVRTRIEGVSS